MEVLDILLERCKAIEEGFSKYSRDSWGNIDEEFVPTMKGHISFFRRVSAGCDLNDLKEILEKAPETLNEREWLIYAKELIGDIRGIVAVQGLAVSRSMNSTWKNDIHTRINKIRAIIEQQNGISADLKNSILKKLADFDAMIDKERTSWEHFLHKAREIFSLIREGGEAAKPACDRFNEITYALIDIHKEFSGGKNLISHSPIKKLPSPLKKAENLDEDIPF